MLVKLASRRVMLVSRLVRWGNRQGRSASRQEKWVNRLDYWGYIQEIVPTLRIRIQGWQQIGMETW
jgi:hypothetical protein